MNGGLKRVCIDIAVKRPKTVLFVSLLLSLVIGSGIRWVVLDDDIFKLLPEDLPSRLLLDQVWEEFGSTDIMLVAFGAPGEPALTPAVLADLWDVSKALEAELEVDETISLATLQRMDADDGFIKVSDLQPRRELAEEEIADIRDYLERNPDIRDMVLSDDGDYIQIVVRPIADAESNRLSDLAERISGELLSGYDVHLGGYPYVRGAVPSLIREDVMKLLRIGVVLMLLVMLGNLRSVSGVAMVLAVIGFSAVTMMGFMGWIVHLTGSTRFYFSVMNTSMPIILMTIANSDGVHIIARFFKEMREHRDTEISVRATMNALMLPVFLTSITTASAFLILVTAPIRAMTGYGVTIAFGILWAWILSSTMLPALISMKKWNPDSRAFTKASLLERVVVRASVVVRRFPRAILVAGVLLVAAVSLGIPLVDVEINIVSFFRRDNPIRQNFDFLDSEMNGTMNLAVKVSGDIRDPEVLREMQVIQEHIGKHPAVKTTLSITDVVTRMHRLVMDDDPEFETIPDSRDKVNNLFTLYSMSGDPEDFSSLVDYDYEAALVTAMMRSVSTDEIVEFVEETKEFCRTGPGKDLDLEITGVLVMLRDFVDLVVQSSLISIAGSILVVFVITWIFFGSALWGAISVIPLLSAVILNFGLMGIFGLELSHITALLSSLIIGVGVDFAVHYIAQFRNFSANGAGRDEITRVVMEDVGYPIMLDAGSNMGFAAVLFSTFLPIQYAGGLIVFAMISTSVGTLTLLASTAELLRNRLYGR